MSVGLVTFLMRSFSPVSCSIRDRSMRVWREQNRLYSVAQFCGPLKVYGMNRNWENFWTNSVLSLRV